jgi:hypothetical protein
VQAEAVRKRNRDSFGGEDWYPPMTGRELLEEVRWMLDANVHPLLIAQELRQSVEVIRMTARRYQDTRVAGAFQAIARQEQQAKGRAA